MRRGFLFALVMTGVMGWTEVRAEQVSSERITCTEMAKTHLSTLIGKGRDRYGKKRSDIWVLNLDLKTLNCFFRYNDGLERVREERIIGGSNMYSSWTPWGTGHRTIRVSQRPGGCSNLYVDQPTIRAATLLETLNGEATYRPAIEKYAKHYFKNFVDPNTGLLRWGVHTSYNVMEDEFQAQDGYQHELLVILPMWDVLWEIDPKFMRTYLEKYWYWHTDEKTGQIDRHNTRGRGLGFAMAAGELILACGFLHNKQPDGPWLDRALQITKAHWDARNKETDLFPNRTYGNDKRFDRLTVDTSIPGCWSSRVLMAGRLAGCRKLTEIGRKSLVAWARYGWDAKKDLPWSLLNPDGTPVDKKRLQGTAYEKQAAYGHWNFWKDYAYGFEMPFQTLMAVVMGAKWTGDAELLAFAKRLAVCYRKQLPANGKRGTFAANYGRLVSFFLKMELLTGEADYRRTAQQIAKEAVGHLWTGKLFRGFSDRAYYSAIEGQGQLLQGLTELDAAPAKLATLQDRNVFLWNY